MAWDYKNPTPPKKGDGRYERKFPESYQTLDVLREHHYDMFKSDLSFNGEKTTNYFGCCETDIFAYYHTAKHFVGEKTNDKNPLFTFATEKGNVGDENQYFEMDIKKDIFMGEHKLDALEYIKTCINELAGRNFNIVLSEDDVIKFIHVPFERTFRGLREFGCDYTTNEFMRWLRMYYEHYYFYVEYVDPIMLANLKPHEKEWLDKIMKKTDGKTDNIEIGPSLKYVNIEQKTTSK